jgi:CrcB protein
MAKLALIAAGGALGAVARYGLAGVVHEYATPHFPWGTFVVNVAGCLLFGLAAGLTETRLTLDQTTRTFLLVGLLGAFTTFSTFTFETFELLRDGQLAAAALNVGGQLALGFLALVGGVWIGRAI